MLVSGIIEGFYGTPWTHQQRMAWASRLRAWGMTHYVWAAKAEPRHRTHWRDAFTDEELAQFEELRRQIALGVALTPGKEATDAEVIAKLRPTHADVAVLSYDDLPTTNAGSQHRSTAQAVQQALGIPVWIVPTHYAGEVSSPYLRALCDGLDVGIEVMWTGHAVVNDAITASQAHARAEVTGRAPLLWDNTPVNDAVMRDALHLGPYTGREESLRNAVSGVLLNPMEFADASVPTVASASAWLRGNDPGEHWREAIGDLQVLAEATAFPNDAHWPGDDPSDEWWERVASLDGVDPALQPWVDHARRGAQLALAPTRLETLLAYPTWAREHPLVLGKGPRVRPTFTQDDIARFTPSGADVVQQGHNLVARRINRVR